MIVGQSPEQYAHARKMTAAAKEMVQSSSRLVDVAKSITIIVQMILRMILVIFMDFTNSSIYEKDELKLQERLYIKLTTTERAPYPYRLDTTEDIALVGYVRYIESNNLSNPYKVPDF